MTQLLSACHTRWEFFPQLCNDMDIKNVKRFTVKSTSRPSLRWFPCSCFAFLFSLQFILPLKGDTTHAIINQKLQGKDYYLHAPNHSATHKTSWFLVLSTPAAAPWFPFSFSWGCTYWFCVFQKNYSVFLIVQLFCKSYISVLKKSNEMTRHRRWRNSNICFKCHKQQRSAQ